MVRRRKSPYSRIEEMRRSRNELATLALATGALGIVLGIFVNGIYELITMPVQEPGLLRAGYIVVLLVALFLVALGLAVAVAMIYYKTESEGVRIDVAIPYLLPNTTQIEIATQHNFRPSYKPAVLARLLFWRWAPPHSDQNRQVVQRWDDARRLGEPFQNALPDLNASLVDALIVFALKRFGEESLGAEAGYDWWEVDLRCESLELTQLPDPLATNPFLNAELKGKEGWRLRVPAGLKLTVSDKADGRHVERTFTLELPYKGRVVLTRVAKVWVADRNSLIGKILGEATELGRKATYYVVGTRVVARATFYGVLVRGTDPFHDWATFLLSFLEESLDWGYFTASRADRIIGDLPWKLGDLPTPNDSIWKKLDRMDERLEKIEHTLIPRNE